MNRSRVKRKIKLRPLVWSGVCLTGFGCTVGPDYQPPDLSDRVGEAWSEMLTTDTPDAEQLESLVSWWAAFDDPNMTTLVERALTTNLNLAEARERIVAARLRRGITNADRLPTLDATGSYSYAETGDEAVAFNGGPPGTETDLYGLGVVAGWEVDLWGRVGRLVEAADAQIDFAVEDYRAARISLAAEVSREVILIRALDAEIQTVRDGIEADRDALSIAQARTNAGFTDGLDVSRASRVLQSDLALIPGLIGDRREAELRIATLLGVNPRDVAVPVRVSPKDAAGDQPATVIIGRDIGPQPPALGLPAELLNRRPDLRKAERDLAAATARIGAATGEKYPKLSLSGTLIFQGPNASDVFNSDAKVLNLGPSLSLPLFDGDRIDQNIKIAESDWRAALIRYERAVVEAVAEVETAAYQHRQQQQRLERVRAAETAARETERLALDLYSAGGTDFLSVIDATTQRLAIQRDRISAEQVVLVRLTDLYTTLGGGWDSQQIR